MDIDTLAPGKTTTLDDCPILPTANISRLAITAECTYNNKAKKQIRLHIISSHDGLNYDTND
ncbi:unnamed protein product, partial [marine sediment metagenome]